MRELEQQPVKLYSVKSCESPSPISGQVVDFLNNPPAEFVNSQGQAKLGDFLATLQPVTGRVLQAGCIHFNCTMGSQSSEWSFTLLPRPFSPYQQVNLTGVVLDDCQLTNTVLASVIGSDMSMTNVSLDGGSVFSSSIQGNMSGVWQNLLVEYSSFEGMLDGNWFWPSATFGPGVSFGLEGERSEYYYGPDKPMTDYTLGFCNSSFPVGLQLDVNVFRTEFVGGSHGSELKVTNRENRPLPIDLLGNTRLTLKPLTSANTGVSEPKPCEPALGGSSKPVSFEKVTLSGFGVSNLHVEGDIGELTITESEVTELLTAKFSSKNKLGVRGSRISADSKVTAPGMSALSIENSQMDSLRVNTDEQPDELVISNSTFPNTEETHDGGISLKASRGEGTVSIKNSLLARSSVDGAIVNGYTLAGESEIADSILMSTNDVPTFQDTNFKSVQTSNVSVYHLMVRRGFFNPKTLGGIRPEVHPPVLVDVAGLCGPGPNGNQSEVVDGLCYPPDSIGWNGTLVDCASSYERIYTPCKTNNDNDSSGRAVMAMSTFGISMLVAGSVLFVLATAFVAWCWFKRSQNMDEGAVITPGFNPEYDPTKDSINGDHGSSESLYPDLSQEFENATEITPLIIATGTQYKGASAPPLSTLRNGK